MGFDLRDIRPGMDVYTRDYVLLGTVQRIEAGRGARPAALVTPGARQSSAVSGELLGPVPTAPLGNAGPRRQSAAEGYATAPDTDGLIGDGSLIVTRWWGLRGRRRVPADLVQTVSLEHVVLRVGGEYFT